MKNDAVNILKTNGLSNTVGRVKILEMFMRAGGALSHADVEKKVHEAFDRVTVYRTLNAFVASGIVHQIATTDAGARYALCKEACMHGHHHDDHVHFICKVCNNTVCLDDVLIPSVKLPKGFAPDTAAMSITGTCKNCKK